MKIAIAIALPLSLPASSANAAPLDLSQYKGKVVYVDFWASWCGPCRQSFPWMMKMQHTYSTKDFVVITVNLDRTQQAAAGFIKSVNNTLPVVYDPNGESAKAYKVSGMPSSFVVGRDGKIRYNHTGFFQNEIATYEKQIAGLINEK